jgi:carboxypeptidase C (cathepsin A)
MVEEKKLQELMDQKKYVEASKQMLKIHLIPGAMTYTMTGFSDIHSILQASPPEGISRFAKFIDSNEVHNYLHVGLHKFEIMNLKAFNKFFADAGHTDVEPFEKLLDKGVKVLVYVPQFDLLAPRLGQERMMNALNWKGKDEFQKADRKIWKVDDDVGGYVKSVNNLQYVMVRNAGFWAIMDQPKWCYDMVERFTSGKMF